MRGRRLVAVGTAIALLFVAAGSALAALHLSGSVHTIKPGEVLSMAASKRTGVVAVGYSGNQMLVERLNKQGNPSRSLGAGSGVAKAVAIQNDGKIVVAGTTAPNGNGSLRGDMVIKRFKPGGGVDNSFGSHGTVHLRGAVANSVTLGPGGTIVAGGSIPGPDGFARVAIARLHGNGSPDGSLGQGGVAEIDLGPGSEANAVVVQKDGKVVFGGDQSPQLQVVNALIGRISSHGSLDGAYGKKGVYVYGHPHGGGASSITALALLGSGKVLAGGGDVENSGQHALFIRMTGGGNPDGGFGSGGVLTSLAERNSISGTNIGVKALALLPGGKIVGVGSYLDSAFSYGALWGVTTNGHLDGGLGGLVKIKLPGALGGEFFGAAVGADGRVYAGGDLMNVPTHQAFVAAFKR